MGPTQPPIQSVLGALSLGVSGCDVKLTTQPHLVPRSKNAWSYTSTPSVSYHGLVLSQSTGNILTLPYLWPDNGKLIQVCSSLVDHNILHIPMHLFIFRTSRIRYLTQSPATLTDGFSDLLVTGGKFWNDTLK